MMEKIDESKEFYNFLVSKLCKSVPNLLDESHHSFFFLSFQFLQLCLSPAIFIDGLYLVDITQQSDAAVDKICCAILFINICRNWIKAH